MYLILGKKFSGSLVFCWSSLEALDFLVTSSPLLFFAGQRWEKCFLQSSTCTGLLWYSLHTNLWKWKGLHVSCLPSQLFCGRLSLSHTQSLLDRVCLHDCCYFHGALPWYLSSTLAVYKEISGIYSSCYTHQLSIHIPNVPGSYNWLWSRVLSFGFSNIPDIPTICSLTLSQRIYPCSSQEINADTKNTRNKWRKHNKYLVLHCHHLHYPPPSPCNIQILKLPWLSV